MKLWHVDYISSVNANGWTALHFTVGSDHVQAIQVLASHGCDLTVEAGNGYTPYHWAEHLSNHDVATEL